MKAYQPQEVTILRMCRPTAGLQAEEARSHRAEREKQRKKSEKVRDKERARRQRTKRLLLVSSPLRHGGRKTGLVTEKLLPQTPTHTHSFSSHDWQAPASVAACQASTNRSSDDFHTHKIYRCMRPRMSSPNAGHPPHDKWESKSSVTRGYTVTAERGYMDRQLKHNPQTGCCTALSPAMGGRSRRISVSLRAVWATD